MERWAISMLDDPFFFQRELRWLNKHVQAGVVSREIVAVLTKGTMVDAEMVCSHQDSAYVLALTERILEGSKPEIGVCAFDCATAEIVLGSWQVSLLQYCIKKQSPSKSFWAMLSYTRHPKRAQLATSIACQSGCASRKCKYCAQQVLNSGLTSPAQGGPVLKGAKCCLQESRLTWVLLFNVQDWWWYEDKFESAIGIPQTSRDSHSQRQLVHHDL